MESLDCRESDNPIHIYAPKYEERRLSLAPTKWKFEALNVSEKGCPHDRYRLSPQINAVIADPHLDHTPPG